MRVIEISSFGGPEVLRLAERPVPSPGRGEVLIKVVAAGVNRPDVIQRYGKYPPPPGASDIPGSRSAGHIAGRGAGVVQWREGDAVCALLAGGGYAEYCVAPQSQCLRPPARLSLVEAAALPETFFTVWTNVFERGPAARAARRSSFTAGRAGSARPRFSWHVRLARACSRPRAPTKSAAAARRSARSGP